MNTLRSSEFSALGDLHDFKSNLYYYRYQTINTICKKQVVRRGQLSDIVMKNYCMQSYQPLNEQDTVLHQMHIAADLSVLSPHFISHYLSMSDLTLNVCLKGWKERTLNPWDDLSMWEDLCIWRAVVCREMTNACGKELNHVLLIPTFHYLELSKAARTLGLLDIAGDYIREGGQVRSMYIHSQIEQAHVLLCVEDVKPEVFSGVEELMTKISGEIPPLLRTTSSLISEKKRKDYDAIHTLECIQKKTPEVLGRLLHLYYKQWKEKSELEDAQHCISLCIQLCQQDVDYKAMAHFLCIAFRMVENPQMHSFISSKAPQIPSSVWNSFLPCLFSRPQEIIFQMFHSVIDTLIKHDTEAVFYPLLTLCQSLGYASHSLYSQPTTLFNGTIGGSVV